MESVSGHSTKGIHRPCRGDVSVCQYSHKLSIPNYLQIAKREVDSHKPEHQRTVPHCELVAKWITQDKQIQPLEHTVDILGTEEEEKYFTINIDPGIYRACIPHLPL